MHTLLPRAGTLSSKQFLMFSGVALALVYAGLAGHAPGHTATSYGTGLDTLSLTSPLVSSVWWAFFLMGNAAILLGAAGTLLEANGDQSLLTRLLIQARQGASVPLYVGALATSVLSPHSCWAVLAAGAFGLLAWAIGRSGDISRDAAGTLAVAGAYAAVLGQGMHLGFADAHGDVSLILAQSLCWAGAMTAACYFERTAQGTRALRYLDATIARRFPNM